MHRSRNPSPVGRRGATSTRLVTLIGGAAGLAALALFLRFGGDGAGAAVEAPRPETEASGGVTVRPLGAGAVSTEASSREDADSSPSAGASERQEVRCLSARDRAPLGGVRVYAEGRPVSEPSDSRGVLALAGVERGSGDLVVWREGFAPFRHRAREPWPAELLLEPAEASLEVEVRGVGTDWRVMRSLLRFRGFGSSDTVPWTPRLREISPGFLLTRGISAGSYDVYLWLRDPAGTPHALSRSGVEIPPGESVRVELDLADEAVEEDG